MCEKIPAQGKVCFERRALTSVPGSADIQARETVPSLETARQERTHLKLMVWKRGKAGRTKFRRK
jgi:hypothetical protein